MFFGSSLFKKSSSGTSTKSPQMKNDFGDIGIGKHQSTASNSPGVIKTALWESICDADLNSSSDLDESMEYFYSRANIFSSNQEKSNSPVSSTSAKSASASNLSNPQRWKTRFFMPNESPKPPKTPEVNNASSPFLRFQSKPSASPSVNNRFSSKSSESPATHSPSVSSVLEIPEQDSLPSITATKSPKVTRVGDVFEKPQDFIASGSRTEISSNTMNQVDEDDQYLPADERMSKSQQSAENHSYPHQEQCSNDEEASHVSGIEKLPLLHLKLRNEAMKLETWKNEMVTKLKKNEEELAEANTLIERLRKSNLELQMDRENASLKLKDEVEQREATEKKSRFKGFAKSLISHPGYGYGGSVSGSGGFFMQSAMQTCIKTKTVQKSLESLLEKALLDFQDLNAQLNVSKENNRDLAEKYEQLSEKHINEVNALSTQNTGLVAEVETLKSEKERFTSVIMNQEEGLKEQTKKLRNAFVNMESLYEDVSQVRLIFEEEVELLKAKTDIRDRDSRVSETVRKCSELSEDLARVSSLLQNSKNVCLEKGQKITALEEEVKRLANAKDKLEEEIHLKQINDEAELQIRQKEIVQLTEKLNRAFPVLIDLVSEKDELLHDFEQEKSFFAFKMRVKTQERKLLFNLEEQKMIVLEKERLIQTLRDANEQDLKQIESLNSELAKREDALKSLEDTQKSLSTSLAHEKKSHEETGEKLTQLQKNEEILNKEILELRHLSSNQKAELENLTAKITALELEQNHMNVKNQDMEKCIELKNDQIMLLGGQMQESEHKIQVLEEAATRACQEARENSAKLAQREVDLAQLRIELQTAESERMAAVKRCDEVRAELLYAVEQQQQESDKVVRQKDKEIETLQSALCAAKKETDKSSKRNEKKMAESEAQVDKLKDQLRDTMQEKKDLSKQLTVSKQRITKLEKEVNEKVDCLARSEKTVSNLDSELADLRCEQAKTVAILHEQETEIERLRRVEAELAELRQSLAENSPPCLTQIPKSIENDIKKTPRSPFLSEKLNQLNLLKTPQRTPKSILKQPGSECKRRRVLLISPEKDMDMDRQCEEFEADIDIVEREDDGFIPATRPPVTPAPWRTPHFRGTPETRTVNIRKTPGSGGSQRGLPTNMRPTTRLASTPKTPLVATDKAKAGAASGRNSNATVLTTTSSSWFDSDETFGLNTEE
ncbi:unnamed protein product [Mesocestoides corti]|uniref:Uncharacterized protein n=5 Tax=Mesocestoides corti TaxID=53468 RepID=A0A0R3UIV0_MESCO|nr:unnamed protein product [Mesocestoides corti]